MTCEIFWILALIAFAIVEFATVGLVSIWFAGGAFCAFVCAMFELNIFIQVGVFIAVSAILILVFRKMALKHFSHSKPDTNLDRIIGTSVMVTETVDNTSNTGRGKINDVEWKLKSKDGSIIEKGLTCTVTGIEGVSLIVTI